MVSYLVSFSKCNFFKSLHLSSWESQQGLIKFPKLYPSVPGAGSKDPCLLQTALIALFHWELMS